MDWSPLEAPYFAVALAPVEAVSGQPPTGQLVLCREVGFIAEALRFIHKSAGQTLVGALLLSALLALFTPRLVSTLIRNLLNVAQKLAEGDLTARTRMSQNELLAGLGNTLDKLAGNLSSTLRQLQDERDLFSRILDSMQEGVMVLDADRRVLLLNSALRDMLMVDPSLAHDTHMRSASSRTMPGMAAALTNAHGLDVTSVIPNPEINDILDKVIRSSKSRDAVRSPLVG